VSIGRALGRLSRWKRRVLCAHDYLYAFDQSHVFLRCAKCNHETPGFTVTGKRPSARPECEGIPDRHRVGKA
jgi:hypothetical protein